MKRALIAAFAAAALSPNQSRAQALYAGIRGGAGIPAGSFAEESPSTGPDALLRNATPGFGYGIDAGIGSPLVGLYGSYDRIRFDCASGSCARSGKYELTGVAAGVRVSVPLLPLLKPWAKAGITYNEVKTSVNGTSLASGKHPGYEVGAGFDVPILMGFFSLTPQVRRVRQKIEIGGVKRAADYYTFDLGLRIRTPL